MVSNGASTCMKKVPNVGGLICVPFFATADQSSHQTLCGRSNWRYSRPGIEIPHPHPTPNPNPNPNPNPTPSPPIQWLNSFENVLRNLLLN